MIPISMNDKSPLFFQERSQKDKLSPSESSPRLSWIMIYLKPLSDSEVMRTRGKLVWFSQGGPPWFSRDFDPAPCSLGAHLSPLMDGRCPFRGRNVSFRPSQKPRSREPNTLAASPRTLLTRVCEERATITTRQSLLKALMIKIYTDNSV